MGEDNLKDFTINWAIFGLLFVCLISFAVTFTMNNNPLGLGGDGNYILNSSNINMETQLYEINTNSNELLNITANTNPETSFLGSRDSVATSYKTAETAKSFWESAKQLISWVFSGETGKMLIATFSGLIGFVSLYFITKWIRTGT